MAKKSKKHTAKRCPPCTPEAAVRHVFGAAIQQGNCDIAARALDKIKSRVGARADHMTPGGRALAFRELLSKEKRVQTCQAKRRERAERHEASESARFNGLLGLGFMGL